MDESGDVMDQRIRLGADAVVIPGAERIVRELAAIKAVDLQCYGDCGCVFCGVFDPAEHELTCLWRMAREWVAANPA